MKTFTLFGFLLLASLTIQAQSFEKGTKLLNAGLRFQDQITPVFVAAEFGVADRIGVGAQLWYARKYDVTFLSPGLFGNYHFAVANEKLDPYAGAGVNLWRASYEGESESVTVFTLQGGLRYFFNERVGAKGQINIDFAEGDTEPAFTLGISFKF